MASEDKLSAINRNSRGTATILMQHSTFRLGNPEHESGKLRKLMNHHIERAPPRQAMTGVNSSLWAARSCSTSKESERQTSQKTGSTSGLSRAVYKGRLCNNSKLKSAICSKTECCTRPAMITSAASFAHTSLIPNYADDINIMQHPPNDDLVAFSG